MKARSTIQCHSQAQEPVCQEMPWSQRNPRRHLEASQVRQRSAWANIAAGPPVSPLRGYVWGPATTRCFPPKCVGTKGDLGCNHPKPGNARRKYIFVKGLWCIAQPRGKNGLDLRCGCFPPTTAWQKWPGSARWLFPPTSAWQKWPGSALWLFSSNHRVAKMAWICAVAVSSHQRVAKMAWICARLFFCLAQGCSQVNAPAGLCPRSAPSGAATTLLSKSSKRRCNCLGTGTSVAAGHPGT